jgi:hypothetical protein
MSFDVDYVPDEWQIRQFGCRDYEIEARKL